MDTKIIRTDPEHIDPAAMREAGRILKEGGLVAFPTETVYGLGGNALDERASGKIYAAKGRPSDNPLIVHIAETDALFQITEEVPKKAMAMAEAFWPGPLTMIFRKNEKVPLATTGGLSSVAVRMPSHPVALAIIREGGGYIAAPSANTSGRPSPTRAEHVCEDLTGKIDMIVDGGAVGIGLESTIVDFTEEVPVILRPGYINQEMIQEVIGPVRMDRGLLITEEKVRPKAPGMKYRHYAPKAQLTIVQGNSSQVTAYINAQCEKAVREGKKPGVIAADETVSAYRGAVVKGIGARNDEEEIARNLFAVLREFDEEDTDILFSEAFDTPRMGQAIMNRLLKAAGHHIIDLDSSF